MSNVGDDRIASRRAGKNNRHLVEAASLILFFAYCILVLTALFTWLSYPSSIVTTLASLVLLGRQIAVDASWLIPTLIATLVVLNGLTFAQAQSGSADMDLVRRRVAVSSYALAGAVMAGTVLVVLGSVGDGSTARRLWSVSVIAVVAVAISLWTGSLVFGTLQERLRAAVRGAAESQRLYEALRGAGAARRGLSWSKLLRPVLIFSLSVAVLSTAALLSGSKPASLDPGAIAVVFGLVLGVTSVPMGLILLSALSRTDPSMGRALRAILSTVGLLAAASVTLGAVYATRSAGFPIPAMAIFAVAQAAPNAWGAIPNRLGSWSLTQLARNWRVRRVRLRRLAYRQELVDLHRQASADEFQP